MKSSSSDMLAVLCDRLQKIDGMKRTPKKEVERIVMQDSGSAMSPRQVVNVGSQS